MNLRKSLNVSQIVMKIDLTCFAIKKSVRKGKRVSDSEICELTKNSRIIIMC